MTFLSFIIFAKTLLSNKVTFLGTSTKDFNLRELSRKRPAITVSFFIAHGWILSGKLCVFWGRKFNLEHFSTLFCELIPVHYYPGHYYNKSTSTNLIIFLSTQTIFLS